MAEPSVDDFQGNDDIEQSSRQNTPPTPPSPDDLESAESKASRKREREVSIEPATPKADELTSEEQKERRRPATKKNRVLLGTTTEEDEKTPPPSPEKPALELATSPPHETKVRQISMKVRGLKWDDKVTPENSQDSLMASVIPETSAESTSRTDIDLEDAAEIGDTQIDVQPTQESTDSKDMSGVSTESSEIDRSATSNQDSTSLTRTASKESDSDDQEKRLKRKMGDRIPSSSTPVPSEVAEPSKRARDDTEEDANPREKKRPSPPPEEDNAAKKEDTSVLTSEPAAPLPKLGGFAAYASTSSPFAAAKGPSVFGTKSTPSPSPLAGTSNGAASSLSANLVNKPSPSPFALASASRSNTSVFGSSAASSSSGLSTSPKDASSPTGTKRTGFEAFASSSSPFATATRSKSPTGFNRSNATSGFGLARSKSPSRRAPGASVNAFKSYVGAGTQSFASPFQPAKKPRQDSSEDSDGTAGATTTSNPLNAASGRTSPEGSEEEAEPRPQTSFADRLRAEKNDEETESSEESKPSITEQEVQTGEEDEETIFQVRGKLYALTGNAWKERGTGQLKLNIRKSDGMGARLLMRKEAVLSLLLNAPLFKGMRCTLAQDPRYLRFSCFEDGSITHYNLRLANTKVAGELLEEIEANIPSDDADDAV